MNKIQGFNGIQTFDLHEVGGGGGFKANPLWEGCRYFQFIYYEEQFLCITNTKKNDRDKKASQYIVVLKN